MKTQTLLVTFCMVACIGHARLDFNMMGEANAERLLASISDQEAKMKAAAALNDLRQAQSGIEADQAMDRLSKVDATAARLGSLYYSGYDREKFAKATHFRVDELNLLFSWLIADGMTEDVYSGEAGFAVKGQLDCLAAKVNETLGTTTLPFEIRKTKDPIDLWNAYSSDALRRWGITQIRASLSAKTWSEEEQRVLKNLLANLESNIGPYQQGKAAPADMGHGADTKRRVPVKSEILPSLINNIASMDISGSSTQWSVVIILVAVSGGLLWLLLKRRK